MMDAIIPLVIGKFNKSFWFQQVFLLIDKTNTIRIKMLHILVFNK